MALRDVILGTAGLVGYWRLGEASSAAPMAEERGVYPGSYAATTRRSASPV